MGKYKAGAEPYAQAHGGEDFSLRVWWLAVAGEQNKELCNIAIMLATITPHAADPERCFSYAAWFKNKQRNCTGIGVLGKLMAIKTQFTERKPAPVGSTGAAGSERPQRSATIPSNAQMEIDPSSLVEEQTEEEPSTGEEVAEQSQGVCDVDAMEVEMFRQQQIRSVKQQVQTLSEACDSTLACMAAGTATSASPKQMSGLLQQQTLQQQQQLQLSCMLWTSRSAREPLVLSDSARTKPQATL